MRRRQGAKNEPQTTRNTRKGLKNLFAYFAWFAVDGVKMNHRHFRRRLQLAGQNRQTGFGDFHVVLGRPAAECGDQNSRLSAGHHTTRPAVFAGLGRPNMAAAVLERVRHFRRLGVGNAEQVRPVGIVLGRRARQVADDNHF